MNVEYLIQVLSNKLIVLTNAKIHAFNAGDLATINSLEEEILTTQNTLTKLKLLLTIDTVANSANTTPADIITSGIESLQSPSIQGPSASAIINGYDISAYATDAQHEQKIQSIITTMPTFTTIGDVDVYIHKIAQDSPLTGEMIANASKQYNVDVPLMLAIMQNDSGFGTLGVGARTNNPGNVGNNGIEERRYPSWQDGVSAVAEWLDRHRVIDPVEVAPLIVAPVVAPAPVPDPAPLPIVTPIPTTIPEPIVNNVIPVTDQATTTPATNLTNTESTTSTSTPNITQDTNATSTATTTLDTGFEATTTPAVDFNSTTTPLIDLGDFGNSTTTSATTSETIIQNTIPEQASSTPDISATSTQAYKRSIKKGRS